MNDIQKFGDIPEGWPECESEQVQVMLLGAYHMDNPGLDEVNIDADDVLTDNRQEQLQILKDSLADWNPNQIAVERPHDNSEAVNDLYGKYQSAEYAYDQEEIFPAPHPERHDNDTECRSEVVQIGFRLADHLSHERIFPVDEHPEEPDTDPFEGREIDSTKKTPVASLNPEEWQREVENHLVSSSIPEYLVWMNQESQLQSNHRWMFDQGIRTASEGFFGSPIALAYWYDRNIRIVHHLWRVLETDTDRMLLIIGSGHIHVLRELLREAPMFCPVSPLPYIS
jgi:hypothetical protein